MNPPVPLATRFAPSPTGYLHLGHLYAAKVAHDLAAATGGIAQMRIEDIDKSRVREPYYRGIDEDLSWLGLSFRLGPWMQSERFEAYADALNRLNEKELTYPCFCTRSDIVAAQQNITQAPHTEDKPNPFGPVYPGTCRNLSETQRRARIAEGKPFSVRLHMDRALAAVGAMSPGPLQFFEGWAAPGWHAAAPQPAGDFVLARKDVGTSYHLAVVLDDAEMGITAVTRGEDLLPVTHIHVLLQCLLGLPRPLYGHHPLVRGADGKRLAKRADPDTVRTLREAGKSREALLAMLPAMPDFGAFGRAVPTNR